MQVAKKARKPFSDATRQKMSDAHKGKTWKVSPDGVANIKAETLRRMEAGTHNFCNGHDVPKEWRENLSKRQTGSKASVETLNKMRAAMTGKKRKHPMTDQARENIRAAHVGKKQNPELAAKRAAANRGKKRSPEARLRMSIAQRLRSQGAKTDESKLWRHRIEYREWRLAVFERDNWTCQKFQVRGGVLHPHHILNFAEHADVRFDVNNGVTLSAKAHKEFHKRYGSSGNTREQLIEFLNPESACR